MCCHCVHCSDKPKFLCNNEIYVKINEPNYRLVCKVLANPDVLYAHLFFIDPYDGNNTVDILDGVTKSGDYTANITVGVSMAIHYTAN